jgi:hypothetical protein
MFKSPTVRGILLVCGAILYSLLSVPGLFAQATGRITGTIVDSTGASVPGVKVACTNLDTGLARTADTNQAGIFEFPDLPIGQYQIVMTRQGFQTQKTAAIPLVTGQVLGLKLTLQVGDVNQSLTVTAEAPLVQSASSSVQSSVTERQMQDLPLNGRNPLQLTTLTPGTVITDVGTESGQQDNRGITVNGLRATQNNFQLDGSIYTNRFFDSVPIMPNPDALQEFTIQSSNYGAEHGGAGALVQLSTRSGTNQLHGTAFEFLRHRAQRAELLQSEAAAFQNQPVRRHGGRPHSKEQDILLLFGPGSAAAFIAEHGFDYDALGGAARR